MLKSLRSLVKKCTKMSEKNESLSEPVDHPLSNRDPNNKKEWVKFEEENEKVKKLTSCYVGKNCSPISMTHN